MTLQEVFNKVRDHLLTQNKRAVDEGQSCLYRDAEGNKCAVGYLIPDDKYQTSLESKSSKQLVDMGILEGCTTEHVPLLNSLMEVHDCRAPIEWPIQLNCVALKYNLTP